MFQSAVQIAGVKSPEEACLLEHLGVDLIGFPLRLGYHTPDIDEDTAREIILKLQDPSKAVLITYIETAREASELCEFIHASIIQLHGEISPLEVQRLREQRPELSIIKSLIVRPEHEGDLGPLLEYARTYERWVDAFITDTFDPKTGACGATGLTHSWKISGALRQVLTKPLIMAGGLRPANVYDAITQVQPAGVDSHTGVEDEHGNKDPELVERFLSEAQRGFDDLRPPAHSGRPK